MKTRFRLVLPLIFAPSLIGVVGYSNAQPPSAPAVGAADRKAAKREFDAGMRSFAAQDYSHAAECFEKAYRLAPHHAALWNAARSWHNAGEIALAANLYARYLIEAPANAPDRNNATTALRKVAAKLIRLQIHASGLQDVKVDGKLVENLTLYVPPGTHSIEAKAGDQLVQETRTGEAGEDISVALSPTAEHTEEEGHAAPTDEKKRETVPEETPSSGWSPTIVYVGSAVTVALAGTTVWSGLNTWSQKDRYDQNPSGTNLAEGQNRQLRTNILLGLSVGAAAFTSVAALWLVDWKGSKPSPSAPAVEAGVGLGGLMVRGRF